MTILYEPFVFYYKRNKDIIFLKVNLGVYRKDWSKLENFYEEE